MKNFKILFILVGLSICSQNIHAQNNAERAKAYYFSAEEQYNSGNYAKSLEYCDQVITLLGNTNARIEALRVKSYFSKGDIQKAKESFDLFITLKPDENLLKEVSPFIVKIEDAEKEEIQKEKERLEKVEYERTHPICYICHGSGRIPDTKECHKCKGSGIINIEETCGECNGKKGSRSYHGYKVGWVWYDCIVCDGKGYNKVLATCDNCDGVGLATYGTKSCDKCNGVGRISFK